MRPSDAAKLLALAAAFDRRTVGESDAIAWADALNGLTAADCAEAVRKHYTDSTDWLMPAHVRAGVRKIRNDRIRAVPTSELEPADVDPNDIEAYQTARLELVHAIADGRPLAGEQQHPRRPVAALVAATAARLPQVPGGAA